MVSHPSNPSPPNRPRLIWSSLVLPICAALVVVLLVCYALYRREGDQIQANALDRESQRMRIFCDLVSNEFTSTFNDVRQLASGDKLFDYLQSGQQADLDRAVRRSVFFSKTKPQYEEVRFIDNSGQEVYRVNKGGVIVLHAQLQNKATRPFFQSALNVGPGQLYLSAFDLNVDRGQVEQPINPTLRFAEPVIDAQGNKRGIFIINYQGTRLIQRLEDFVPKYANRLRILNSHGYWIRGAKPEDDWGFALPGHRDQTLAVQDPQLWQQILAQPEGQIPYHGGYFTWTRLIPVDRAKADGVDIVSEEPFFILASQVSREEWNDYFYDLRENIVVVAAILSVLAVIISWIYHARQRVKMERDRFFNLTRDMLCIAGFDGKFKRVNNAWEESLGYAKDELVGQPFLKFVHPDDQEKTQAEAARLARGEESIGFENRYRTKQGTWRWLAWSARPLASEQLIFASARDLSERKRLEDKLQALNDALEQRADLLEATNRELEAFSYSVSHDLRAPLRHIHGFVELLQKDGEVGISESSRRYMNVISKAAHDMGVLIDDLLALSRTGRAEMHVTQVNMTEMIQQIIDERELECRDRTIIWKIDKLSPASGDPSLLRLVWTNLIDNALKYTRPRVDALIEIGQIAPGSAERNGHAADDDQVYFVRDNGVGFDMTYAAKLFGVFQRLHRADQFEGTGIGLANVQRIVVRHGGKVWADSRLDVGSIFYFSLPINSHAV